MALKFIKKTLKFFTSKLFLGFLLGLLVYFTAFEAVHYTSTDKFCEACHVHPHSTETWKQGPHYDNDAGIFVHCVECHLPPGGVEYLTEKARTGARDLYGFIFKDKEKINWDEKSRLEHAVHFTYTESCKKCHQNLFPIALSKKGEDAHLYYSQKEDELQCINCHLHVGHYSEEAEKQETFGKETVDKTVYKNPTKVNSFINYTEQIPQSSVAFDMVAITGGKFTMGSPENEPYRDKDEGPQHTVEIKPFWMGKTEVTWDEFEAFYKATSAEGRTDSRSAKVNANIDAITGPTPPYGSPDQSWGRGQRPAITMTFHTAQVYCEWLTQVTGKKYRLPTEAEWEYAARAGQTEGPYFFEGNPKKFSQNNFWNKIFGVDTTNINSYVIYKENGFGKTQEPTAVKPNPFGLINMLGNVREFCSDWYAPNTYQKRNGKDVTSPTGPESGTEHVVRGGSFKSDAMDVRISARDFTQHDKWMVTDPQIPKSLWWYSDVIDVGFRVVCEVDDNIKIP